MKSLIKVIKCIQSSIKKSGVKTSNKNECLSILKIYKELYNFVEENMSRKIDSFDEAACLLMSMIKNNITNDRKINCEIAVDACIEMFKKPIIEVNDKIYELEKIECQIIERQILIDGIYQNKPLPNIIELSNCLRQIYKNAIGNRKVKIKTYYKQTVRTLTE